MSTGILLHGNSYAEIYFSREAQPYAQTSLGKHQLGCELQPESLYNASTYPIATT